MSRLKVDVRGPYRRDANDDLAPAQRDQDPILPRVYAEAGCLSLVGAAAFVLGFVLLAVLASWALR